MTRFPILASIRLWAEPFLLEPAAKLKKSSPGTGVSPAFVQQLVREHPSVSVIEIFHLRGLPLDRALNFLLRCHKGCFCRHHYPSLAFEQSDES